jgi:hypothetical protein
MASEPPGCGRPGTLNKDHEKNIKALMDMSSPDDVNPVRTKADARIRTAPAGKEGKPADEQNVGLRAAER